MGWAEMGDAVASRDRMVLRVAAGFFRVVAVLLTVAGFDASFSERRPGEGIRNSGDMVPGATVNSISTYSRRHDKQSRST